MMMKKARSLIADSMIIFVWLIVVCIAEKLHLKSSYVADLNCAPCLLIPIKPVPVPKLVSIVDGRCNLLTRCDGEARRLP